MSGNTFDPCYCVMSSLKIDCECKPTCIHCKPNVNKIEAEVDGKLQCGECGYWHQ